MNIEIIALLVFVVATLDTPVGRRVLATPIGRKAETVAAWVFTLVLLPCILVFVGGFLWYVGLRSILEVLGMVLFSTLLVGGFFAGIGALFEMPYKRPPPLLGGGLQ